MAAVSGKVVVVTGGRRGLGAALVDEVLARGAAKIYATATTPFEDDRPAVVALPLDIRSEDSVAAFAELASDAQIVINNAGIFAPDPLLTGAFNGISDSFDVNVFGPLRMARAFAPILKSNGGGALVDIHSVLSWLAGAGAYGASKAALWSLTNSLRLELAEQHTQVLGVHVGYVDTDMASDIAADKLSPAAVAKAVIDGLEHGDSEVLVDDISAHVKAALSGPVENLALPH
ncbi:SDR family oxidoreductase [Mycolicibacterium sp. 018/SC-01/001]|uniref:SDR family oxidoreductase n=1 Tax=Mycolicibacterium sp. 018/SC-01/001 TaxID=2592069 RepID=UPI0011803487|nr:SDR family oxidoreductase [Mycolicibacterium sp. 018/SC-01/001]TRW89152.1 SDR family oxidoreductase [Mycolicibacterium sp. 018/SC-01/001]